MDKVLIKIGAIAFLVFFMFIYNSSAQEDKLLKQGISYYRAENYDEALEIFKKLREANPDSSLAAYYLGITYKRLENYTEAKTHLEASLHMSPKIKGALIELIDVLYRLNEIKEAKAWIKVAEDEGVRPAQAAFLKGLTLFKNEEYKQAISSFESAKGLDTELTQSANYQIGIAYLRLSKFNEARDVFKDIIVLDPHTDIAAYAEKYIDALERKIEQERPLHMTLRFAFEYDTNVVLKPTDTSLVTDITDKDDTRVVYDLKGDYTFKTQGDVFSLKTEYNLHISKQNDFGRYDVIGNTVSLQPNLSFKKALVSFPVNYSHLIVDEKNYLSAFTTGNVNNVLFGNSQMGQVGVVYKYKDYLKSSGGDEDRSGNELMATTGLFWFLSKNEGFLGIKYGYNKDFAKGSNWDYSGHRASLSLLVPFLEKFKFNANGEIFLQDYDKTHTIYNKKRKDLVYTASSFLSYEVVKNVELQFSYTYINDKSNLSIYEYRRDILSAAVQYKF